MCQINQQITFPIVEITEDNSNHKGIYCFIKNGKEIVYIGETRNFGERYQQHYEAAERRLNRLGEKISEAVKEGNTIEMGILRDITKEVNNSFGGYFEWCDGKCVAPPQTDRELLIMESTYIALFRPVWNEQGITKPYPLPTDEYLAERRARGREYYKKKGYMLGNEE